MTVSPAPLDLDRLRRRLAGTRGREYWRSLEEVARDPELAGPMEGAFSRPGDSLDNGFNRRRLLQLMAASVALGGLSGCGPEADRGQLAPYVKAPPGIVPGVSRHYATATVLDGYGTGILVRHFMGRPIKVEGNPDHPASLGATSHWGQATILGLYDPERSQAPLAAGRVASREALTAALAEARGAVSATKGAGLRILTGAVSSPTLVSRLSDLLKRFPAARWHRWDAIDRDQALAGAELAFGRPLEPLLRPERANVILAVGSDFLSYAPGHLRYARAFAARRRAAEVGARMSRLYAVESTPTLAGAMADHRWAMRPDEIGLMLRSLASALGAAPRDWGPEPEPRVIALAQDLLQHRGAAAVHIGPEQPAETQAIGHVINAALDAPGRTLDLIEPVASAPGEPGSLADLGADMRAGKVEALLILGLNPVFAAPADVGFAEALRHVRLSVHLGQYVDETASACSWHVPEAHELEAWSDCRAFDGTAAVLQPQAQPFYGGISAQELLALFEGEVDPDGLAMVRGYWRNASGAGPGFESFWIQALRQGVIPGTASKPVQPVLKKDVISSLAPPKPVAAGSIEVLFRPDEGLWDGRFANNGWLQEMPRWQTRLVWDNAALMAPATAERLGLGEGDLVEIAAGGRTVRIPVAILPGQARDCITLPLGYGRRVAGRVGANTGFDVYPLRSSSERWRRQAEIAKTDGRYPLAFAQHADRMAGRDIVKSGSLEQFLQDRDFLRKAEERAPDRPDRSLYPGFRYEGNAWAMAINLNSCIGCGACVVACAAENNTPVVGKEEALRGRLMHWLRIDRYYSGPPDEPDTYFQPVPCMHCEQAPCEVVCPVQATVHDSDGLNLMVYNRCVGTRFCSNNCPYKVRRFNFFGYAFKDPRLGEAWNPDVTVRDRGVMEKCTYCVQRIREAKIAADREDRPVRDGEVVTACQAACPTEAIVFGDRNDPESAVSKRKASPLDYALLAELNTRPRTTYEARLSNRNARIGES